MKTIVTTLTKSFPFNLSGTHKLVIDPRIPTEVSDEEYQVLKTRLGNQIKEYTKPISSGNASIGQVGSNEKKTNTDDDDEDL